MTLENDDSLEYDATLGSTYVYILSEYVGFSPSQCELRGESCSDFCPIAPPGVLEGMQQQEVEGVYSKLRKVIKQQQ